MGNRRIVPQLAIVHVEVGDIEAEAVDAALQPEAGDVEDRLLDLRIVEVEVRLLLQEVVEIVLAAARLPVPGRAAEHRQPVVGRRPVLLWIGPDVPVGLGVVAAAAALLEPRMAVRGMRVHLIDDHPQPEPMGFGQQAVEVGEGAEHRVDVAVVGDVVAEVLHRRGEERRQPDAVDAETGDIRELAGDAGEITDAVTVGIEEAARIDLVDDRAAPPVAHPPSPSRAAGELAPGAAAPPAPVVAIRRRSPPVVGRTAAAAGTPRRRCRCRPGRSAHRR